MAVAMLMSCGDSDGEAGGAGGGGGGSGGAATGCSPEELTALEAQMRAALEGVSTDHSYYVELQRPDVDDRVFTFSRDIDGPLDADATIQSASTAKLVTAAVILDVVANPSRYGTPGTSPLTLDSLARDFLPDGQGGTLWRTSSGPLPATNRLHTVTLRQLLSFTSGLELERIGANEPCFPNPAARFSYDACVTQLIDINLSANENGGEPRTFFYSGAHMFVASKMAVSAVNATGWADIFKRFKEAHGVFQGAVEPAAPEQAAGPGAYFPFSEGASSPSPAGALRYRAGDYASFLRKLNTGEILPAEYMDEMFSNQLEKLDATVEYSPVADTGEDWRYGFGVWNECPASTYDEACFEGRFSSPGSFGSYPFLDANLYDGTSFSLVGFVGRGGSDPGTSAKGIGIYRSLGGGTVGVKDLAQRWAADRCQ